ncbi:hypothetical protein DFQ28_007119 [Apophysomyces sp. BC1034]|nr:hypothetical protein DFQ30_007834 [Apophysomyces sp. BC1015]KAG0181940.1 hypothetical protein DFQ29_006472 [Apophysomyces sp. BC1021]KAG0192933.1 hypothetical protein DFQ28_007119 [Apophysomyces sp. BC1034]
MSAPVEEKPVEQKPVSVEDVAEELAQEETRVEKPESRGEKKARKAILSLGLKAVPGINRVTFTRPQGMLFVISQPEVFKSTNSDTFIVFGEMQVEDMKARAQQAAAQQLAAEAAAQAEQTEAEAPAAVEAVAEEEEDEGEVDATGVDEKDIALVISQANVSRNKAIKALKNNDNDIVQAIMEVTM